MLSPQRAKPALLDPNSETPRLTNDLSPIGQPVHMRYKVAQLYICMHVLKLYNENGYLKSLLPQKSH
jgi:hypothetical protein